MARQAHDLKVIGSNPIPDQITKLNQYGRNPSRSTRPRALFLCPSHVRKHQLTKRMREVPLNEEDSPYHVRAVASFAAFLAPRRIYRPGHRYAVPRSSVGARDAMNGTIAALRFSFTQTLALPDLARKLIRRAIPASCRRFWLAKKLLGCWQRPNASRSPWPLPAPRASACIILSQCPRRLAAAAAGPE
jgi:hypothetical protein